VFQQYYLTYVLQDLMALPLSTSQCSYLLHNVVFYYMFPIFGAWSCVCFGIVIIVGSFYAKNTFMFFNQKKKIEKNGVIFWFRKIGYLNI
jgi:hypothetical protein